MRPLLLRAVCETHGVPEKILALIPDAALIWRQAFRETLQ